jgi:hypothetical protein
MELKKEHAKQIYEHVPDEFKRLLEKEFKPETFRKIDFRDLLTFDNLCKANETTEQEFEAKWKELPVSQTIKTVAKFEILSDGINQGWRPNTLDTTEKKWFPIFSVSSSGLVFSSSFYSYGFAYAHVGFPFCFKTKEQSDHAGKQFINLWEEFYLRKIA